MFDVIKTPRLLNVLRVCFVIASFWTLESRAECPRDCDKVCCTEVCVLGACSRLCDPTGSCQATCSAYNLTCGVPPKPPTPLPVLPSDNPVNQLPTKITNDMILPAATGLVTSFIDANKKLVDDVLRNLEKAGKDTQAELGRAGRNIEDLGQASGNYMETIYKGKISNIQTSLNRIADGKAVDALWHLATDDLRLESDASAAAATKSSIINTAGTLAASIYGGPGGAAAYAAWLTYYQSGGNVELALKVGALAGATSWALQSTGKLPVTDASGNIVASDLAKKTALTGAIGGLSVAAAGGDEKAVKDGFIRGGGMVLIQAGYQHVTRHSLDDESFKASKGKPYCWSTNYECQQPPKEAVRLDSQGKPVGLNQAMLDKTAPHVGTMAPSDPNASLSLGSEASNFMKGVSKIPGTNAFAVFHDQWAEDWRPAMDNKAILVGTIAPAAVLTYNGSVAPLLEQVRATSQEEWIAAKNDEKNVASKPLVYLDQTNIIPIDKLKVERAFLCAKNDDSKSFLLELDANRRHFACRVIYRSNGKRLVAWQAMNDPNYCKPQIKKFVAQHLDWGYECIAGLQAAR